MASPPADGDTQPTPDPAPDTQDRPAAAPAGMERPASQSWSPRTLSRPQSSILTHSQVSSRQRQRSIVATKNAEEERRHAEEDELRRLRQEMHAQLELMARTGGSDRVTDDNRALLVIIQEYREKCDAQAAELRTLRQQLDERDSELIEEVVALDERVVFLEGDLKHRTETLEAERDNFQKEATATKEP